MMILLFFVIFIQKASLIGIDQRFYSTENCVGEPVDNTPPTSCGNGETEYFSCSERGLILHHHSCSAGCKNAETECVNTYYVPGKCVEWGGSTYQKVVFSGCGVDNVANSNGLFIAWGTTTTVLFAVALCCLFCLFSVPFFSAYCIVLVRLRQQRRMIKPGSNKKKTTVEIPLDENIEEIKEKNTVVAVDEESKDNKMDGKKETSKKTKQAPRPKEKPPNGIKGLSKKKTLRKINKPDKKQEKK